nr:helix-turn-helix transcriptional regulator [Adonisia turfae]
MIQWKLRQVMADRQMTNRALADLVGMHETSISNMKRRNDMPRIDGVLLNGLCNALSCTPFDLIVYSVDAEEPDGDRSS